MWTETTGLKYQRSGPGYATEVSDAEWRLVAPRLPGKCRLGRPRAVDLRAIFNAILYIARTGCQWRPLPRDFPPFTTVQHDFYAWRNFYAWRDGGVLERINFELLGQTRAAAAREPSPSAGVIDSQSVKTTESGGPRGDDAGKKVKGRKRHIITDTGSGLLVGGAVHPADVQDRDGAVLVVQDLYDLFPWLRHLVADSAHAGDKRRRALPNSAAGRSRSSSAPPRPRAWKPSPAVGWSSAPSPGSTATAASPKTLRPRSPAPRPGSTSPLSKYFCEGLRGYNATMPILSRTLRQNPVRGISGLGDCALE